MEQLKKLIVESLEKDTRDDSDLFVYRLSETVDKKDFAIIKEAFMKNKGYYSKFKKGFISKQKIDIDGLVFDEAIMSKTSNKNVMLENKEFGVKVGDVFVNSWGYEQTNTEFYQVVGLKGKSTVILKEIMKQHGEAYSPMSGTVKPRLNQFLENSFFMSYESNKDIESNLYIKRMQKWGERPYIKLGKRYNAYLTSPDKAHYESSYYWFNKAHAF